MRGLLVNNEAYWICLNRCTIPAVVWRACENPRKPSVMIVGFTAEFRNEYHSNTILELRRYTILIGRKISGLVDASSEQGGWKDIKLFEGSQAYFSRESEHCICMQQPEKAATKISCSEYLILRLNDFEKQVIWWHLTRGSFILILFFSELLPEKHELRTWKFGTILTFTRGPRNPKETYIDFAGRKAFRILLCTVHPSDAQKRQLSKASLTCVPLLHKSFQYPFMLLNFVS